MSLDTIALVIASGLLVLIWMIQLVVYPSFSYYNSESLVIWHKKYTNRFGPIVMPLMIGQLGIGLYQVITAISTYTIVNFIIITLLWSSTFLQFVPIHDNIAKGKASETMLVSLVKKNWIRTVLWTILFLCIFSKFTIYR